MRALEESADRPRAEAGGVDRHLGAAVRPGQRDAVHDFIQRARDRRLIESAQEAIQRGEVRNRAQLQSAAQFGMLGQAHFDFAIGPVLVAHRSGCVNWCLLKVVR
jgi:hypothetical protein